MDGPRPLGPVDTTRRKLLLALGFGTATVGLSRRLGTPTLGVAAGAGEGGSATPTTSIPSAGASAVAGIAAPGPAPESVPVLDPAAEVTDPAHVYDVVIRGGRVMDPDSGLDAVLDVGIDGRRVTRLAVEPLNGRTTIDAAGLVVAPGFIDILSYNPNGYGEYFKIADGVTANLGMHGLDAEAGAFFGRWDAEGCAVHYGGAADNAWLRPQVGLDPYDTPDAAGLERLVAKAEADLGNGFLGIHMQPEYTPGSSYEELRAHGRLCQESGVPLCVHARHSDDLPPGTQAEAMEELVRLARDTGAWVHVEHINSTGGTGRMEEALATMEAALAEGLRMSACIYPYTFWATYLRSARYEDWQEKYGISYDSLQVAGTPQRLTEATFRQAFEANKLTAAFTIPEEDIRAALRAPWVMLGSDAILERSHNNHPRATGCFARLFGTYVRDTAALSLMDALAKVTILPARLLEGRSPMLRRKGRMQVGADADVCVFDPATIADRSTIEDPAQESVGVAWVLVNGTVMKDPEGVRRDERPGEAVRAEL
jgi:N-acyl-D-aspartate/D-glutamate deacylase